MRRLAIGCKPYGGGAMRITICAAVLAIAAVLTADRADAQVRVAGGYNTLTGRSGAAARAYNPMTGRASQQTTTHNAFTGRTTRTKEFYNPMTGRSGAAAA